MELIIFFQSGSWVFTEQNILKLRLKSTSGASSSVALVFTIVKAFIDHTGPGSLIAIIAYYAAGKDTIQERCAI